MIDYNLKFSNESAAHAALYTLTFYQDSEGNEASMAAPRYYGVDMIGPIEGTTGWHVNVRTTAEAPELDAYRVYPVTPVRVWF